MENQILQFPALISKIITMANHSLRITVDSQENLTSEQIAKIVDCYDKFGYFNFLVDKMIKPEDLLNIPDVKPEFKTDKSISVRMRNVIWRIWEKKGKQGDFDIFYKSMGEKIIEQLKTKLD
jgi:hypothetical protein